MNVNVNVNVSVVMSWCSVWFWCYGWLVDCMMLYWYLIRVVSLVDYFIFLIVFFFRSIIMNFIKYVWFIVVVFGVLVVFVVVIVRFVMFEV